MKVLVKKSFMYDEEIDYIECGIYDFIEGDRHNYPSIKYKGEWLDLADIDAIKNNIQILNE